MSFRHFKAKGLPVVRISGVPYVLDMERKELRGVLDPADVIELDEGPRSDDGV